ncbi:MAG TPA: hypothetical protein VMT43_03090 [Acidimicrobiales bacterium]|nr:hypothetical protein [Acidimicrobiales bacterium]
MDPRHARSRGLRQVNRVTSWLVGGALVASGGFVALLARPHSTAAGRATAGSGAGVTTTLDPFGGGGGAVDDGGPAAQPLNPPVQPPLPSASQGQVSTGAS